MTGRALSGRGGVTGRTSSGVISTDPCRLIDTDAAVLTLSCGVLVPGGPASASSALSGVGSGVADVAGVDSEGISGCGGVTGRALSGRGGVTGRTSSGVISTDPCRLIDTDAAVLRLPACNGFSGTGGGSIAVDSSIATHGAPGGGGSTAAFVNGDAFHPALTRRRRAPGVSASRSRWSINVTFRFQTSFFSHFFGTSADLSVMGRKKERKKDCDLVVR